MEMSKLRKDYQHIMEAPVYRQVTVTICASAPQYNVRAFMEELSRELDGLVKEVRYQQLPYNNIEKFVFHDKDIDAMILCHSIENRRFAVTDVMDALYNEFLPKAARELGRDKICVIVHDMPTEAILNDARYEEKMNSFRQRQPTTFKNATTVFISGQLANSPAQIGAGNWTELRTFVAKASRLSEAPPARALRKVLVPALAIFTVILVIVIGLSIGLS